MTKEIFNFQISVSDLANVASRLRINEHIDFALEREGDEYFDYWGIKKMKEFDNEFFILTHYNHKTYVVNIDVSETEEEIGKNILEELSKTISLSKVYVELSIDFAYNYRTIPYSQFKTDDELWSFSDKEEGEIIDEVVDTTPFYKTDLDKLTGEISSNIFHKIKNSL